MCQPPNVLGIPLDCTYFEALSVQLNVTFVFHPICISKKKLKNYSGGQPHPRLEGVTILRVQSVGFYKTIFVGKIHRNSSNIHKVMTLCVNWSY